MKETRDAKLIRVLTYAAGAIFLLVPFHALLTTWAGSNFGELDLFRIWKELLLIPLTAGAGWLVLTDNKLKATLKKDRLVWLITIYGLLNVWLGLIALKANRLNGEALAYGLIVNLRFLLFFLICLVLALKSSWLTQHWQKILLWPAVIVIVFGLLQLLVLPSNFLSHFGYGADTIPAIHTIDRNPDYVRIQSTLRGPNPLGAYLVIVITSLVALTTFYKKRLKLAVLISAGLAVMIFTYSRSAWLGTVFSAMVLIYFVFKDKKWRRIGIATFACLLIVAGSAVVIWRRSSVLENTLFHTSTTSRSLDNSNEVRVQALSKSVESIVDEPLGRGPGTAGPASFRNDHPSHIAENYFVQIGQEVGVLGVGIFIAICIVTAGYLWRLRSQPLPLILLASFIGLSLVNLLSHAWTDDTLAYLWWGLAGLAIGPNITGIIKQNAKTDKT